MTAPPKYEDLVLKVAELERSEAALLEELERSTARYDREVLGLNNEGDPIGGDPAGGYRNDNARLQQRLTVAEQKLGDAYEWGYGDGQNAPNGYSDKEDREKCVAELLKQAADCEHGYSNQTGCPVCQGIKP